MLSPSLFLPYLVLAVVVTVIASRRASTPSRKRWTAIGAIAFFWAFGYIDDVIGGIQHKWLCHKEAGFWIYEPAKLPRELFHENGAPRFITGNARDDRMLAPYVRFEWHVAESYRSFFVKIDRVNVQARATKVGELLGQLVDFSVWPSNFFPTFSQASGHGCFQGPEDIRRWWDWDHQVLGIK